MLLLRSIVLEYIHPSMYYKLGTRLEKKRGLLIYSLILLGGMNPRKQSPLWK